MGSDKDNTLYWINRLNCCIKDKRGILFNIWAFNLWSTYLVQTVNPIWLEKLRKEYKKHELRKIWYLKLLIFGFVWSGIKFKMNEYILEKWEKIRKEKHMPVKIISGHPCRNCGCWSVEVKTDCEYYWVNFGVVLVEEITNYICRNCKCVLIEVINHKEEKLD